MFHLVLSGLPFNVLLVYEQPFFCQEAAEAYKQTNYPDYPALEVWTGPTVDNWKAKVIHFPLGAKHGR